MSMPFNVSDVIIRHVKNIVDSTRCTVCDKADGGRVRFACGHTSCDDCLVGNEGCMLCLTPNSLSKPKSDDALSQRIQNACDLLNVCQDTFNLDVYRRLRVSEQLRAEKELFPDCIQAPAKYSNKRKSNNLIDNKENTHSSFHPGEHISHTDSFKMKKCSNYVQQWLDSSKSYPRKALGDLIVNKQINTSNKIFKQNPVLQNKKSYIQKNAFDCSQRKRSHSAASVSHLDKNSTTQVNTKTNKKSKYESCDKKAPEKTDNDESGIVLDDEPILIEDSQSQIIDKDKLALLAVEAADQESSNLVTLERTLEIDLSPPVFMHEEVLSEGNQKNVPFYKKAPLGDCCCYRKEDHRLIENSKNDDKNVAISIENKHFVTTINISQCANVVSDKKSVLVQTTFDEIEQVGGNHQGYVPDHGMKEKEGPMFPQTLADSLNILQPQSGKKMHEDTKVNKKGGITIYDSDSEESLFRGSFLEVTAEVHRSCEPLDYGILSEISTNELPLRGSKKKRCITPDSNNSSDKENCDPNKRKKLNNGKKNKKSKK